MPSLREKLGAEKSKTEAVEASLREKLEAEKLKAEQEEKNQELRSQIASREEQKKVLDEAIEAIKGGYVARAGGVESFKKVKTTAKAKKEALAEADAVVEKLWEDFKDAFEAKRIKTREELLENPDYQEEKEIQDYKKTKTEDAEAQKNKQAATAPIRESAAALRAAKRKAIETAPDLGLREERSFSKQGKEESLEKLSQYSAVMGEEIEKLKIQTPEGQEAAKEKFKAKFAERFKNSKFFTQGNWNYLGGLVKEEDISDSQKYGEEIVAGALRSQAEARLKNEVDQGKEKAGILTAGQELEALKGLPERCEIFGKKVRELTQKRESVIRELSGKESVLAGRIRRYFGHERGNFAQFGQMLESDFARAWLLHTEKDYMCEQFYGGKYNWRWDDKAAAGGVPAILTDFLEKKRGAVITLRDQGTWRSGHSLVQAGDLFDPNSFEEDLRNYENFLDTFGGIVQNQADSIASTGRGISGNTKPSDLDLLHDKLGLKTSDKPPFQPLKLKSQEVAEGLAAGKSFSDIGAEVKKKEEPFNKAFAERQASLSRLIDKEWTEQELRAFEKAHPEARGLQDKAEKIEMQRAASRELIQPLLKVRELIQAGASGVENNYNNTRLRLIKTSGNHWYFDIKYSDFEAILKKQKTAEEELKEIRRKLASNQNLKRPFIHFGKPKLDQELEVLRAEEITKASEFKTADEALKSLTARQNNLIEVLSPMASIFAKSRFDVGDEVSSVAGFLSRVQTMIDNSSANSLSPAEAGIIDKFSKFQKEAQAKQTSYNKLPGNLSYEVSNQLRSLGWSETKK